MKKFILYIILIIPLCFLYGQEVQIYLPEYNQKVKIEGIEVLGETGNGVKLDGDKDGNYRLPILDGRFEIGYENENNFTTGNFKNLGIDFRIFLNRIFMFDLFR